MKTISILALSLMVAACFSLSACNRSNNGVEAAREPNTADRANNMTAEDREFIQYASEMHSGEIALAQLAKEKSSTEGIRDYADNVIKTHTDALKKLSDRTGENRTRENTNPSSDTKNHMEYLKPMSGDQFDREFIVLMIADNQDAANTFKQPFVAVQNNDLKKYMNDVVPSLESNVTEAKKLQK